MYKRRLELETTKARMFESGKANKSDGGYHSVVGIAVLAVHSRQRVLRQGERTGRTLHRRCATTRTYFAICVPEKFQRNISILFTGISVQEQCINRQPATSVVLLLQIFAWIRNAIDSDAVIASTLSNFWWSISWSVASLWNLGYFKNSCYNFTYFLLFQKRGDEAASVYLEKMDADVSIEWISSKRPPQITTPMSTSLLFRGVRIGQWLFFHCYVNESKVNLAVACSQRMRFAKLTTSTFALFFSVQMMQHFLNDPLFHHQIETTLFCVFINYPLVTLNLSEIKMSCIHFIHKWNDQFVDTFNSLIVACFHCGNWIICHRIWLHSY